MKGIFESYIILYSYGVRLANGCSVSAGRQVDLLSGHMGLGVFGAYTTFGNSLREFDWLDAFGDCEDV